MTTPKKNESSLGRFEDAMKRLDEIVAKLEEEKLSLEEMITLYEEGVTLARHCNTKLNEAEQKVRLIARQANGETLLKNFDDHAED